LYFEGDLTKLRRIGLRGACEMLFLWQDLEATDPEKATALVGSASKVLRISEDEFRNGLEEITNHPHTAFVANTWASRKPIRSKHLIHGKSAPPQ
jgi:hypothetical protein